MSCTKLSSHSLSCVMRVLCQKDFTWVLPGRELSTSPNLPQLYCPGFLWIMSTDMRRDLLRGLSSESTHWILVLFHRRGKSGAVFHLGCLSLPGSPNNVSQVGRLKQDKHIPCSSGVVDKVDFILRPFPQLAADCHLLVCSHGLSVSSHCVCFLARVNTCVGGRGGSERVNESGLKTNSAIE